MKTMVTGHRFLCPNYITNKKIHIENIKVLMINWIIKQQYGKNTSFATITGMATGTDQLFADCVIELKKVGYKIKLIAAIPFIGQEKLWPDSIKKHYYGILEKCDSQVIVSDGDYKVWKMQKRNEWMVNHCDKVLAVWNGTENGGTHNCLKYAIKMNKSIDILNPYTLDINEYINGPKTNIFF